MIRWSTGIVLVLMMVATAQADEPHTWEVGLPQFFALSVADLDAMASWYETMLGLEQGPVNEFEDGAVRQTNLRSDRLIVELVQHHAAKDRASYGVERSYFVHGIYKVGFFVEEIDEVVAELERKGASFRGGLVEIPEQGIRMLLVEDPEGNIVQLFEAIEQ